jgi:predicted permease
MRWLRATWMRIATMFRRERRDREMDAELRFHIETHAADLMREGLPREEAMRQARVAFGGMERAKEECRDAIGMSFVESVIQDLRFGLRMLRKNPGFAAVAVLTLALGIGANTAVYSLLDALIVRSLPVRDAQDLLMVKWTARQSPKVGYSSFSGTCSAADNSSGKTGCSFSEPFYRKLRSQSDAFSDLAAFAPTLRLKVSVGDHTELAFGDAVSGNYFQILGIRPYLGRVLDDADDQASAAPVIVLNYSFWQKTLGGDPSIIGETFNFNGSPFTVVGIAENGFGGLRQGDPAKFWISLSGDALVRTSITARRDSPENWWITLIGRLKPGTSAGSTQAAVTAFFSNDMRSQPSFFDAKADPEIVLVPVEREFTTMREESSKPLFTVMGVVGIVLLIACTNIGGLVLARGAAREREMAVRQALGAGRGRLVRQVLAETVMLSAAGGAAGIQLAYWATAGLRPQIARIARGLPQSFGGPNPRVLLFTMAVSVAAGILFGLAPALRSTRIDLGQPLKIVGAASLKKGRGGRFSLGSLFVVAQVSLTVALLAGAGLLLRTLRNLETADIGFDRSNLLLFSTNWGTEDSTLAQVAAFNRRLLDQLRVLPGVTSASYSDVTPLSGSLMTRSICCSAAPDRSPMQVDELPVSPDFFTTMKVPVLAGRAIEQGDVDRATTAMGSQAEYQKAVIPIVVNEEFVRSYFKDQNVVGRIFDHYRVVGVAGDLKYGNLRREIQPAIYSPAVMAFSFELRTQGEPEALIPAVRSVASRIDSQIKLADVTTQSGQIEQSISGDRFIAWLLTAFAGLALVLACIGVYGLLSYEVTRHTREIGIRIALGAQRRDILKAVMTRGMAAAGVGVMLGLGVAGGVTRYVESMLYGVRATDGATFAGAAVVLLGAALAACWIPARRAMQVDPIIALRHE